QYIEVRGRDTHEQRLLGGLQGRRAGVRGGAARGQRGPAAHVDETLVQSTAQRTRMAVVGVTVDEYRLAGHRIGDVVRRVVAAMALLVAEIRADLGQQLGARLVDVFVGRELGGFRTGQYRVGRARLLVDLEQVLGLHP